MTVGMPPPNAPSACPAGRRGPSRWAALIREAFRVWRTEGLGRVIRKTVRYLSPPAPPPPPTARLVLSPDRYCDDTPSNQTTADVLQGAWHSMFPDDWGAQGGAVKHFDFAVDQRVKWANEVLPGGVKGMTVLELGPFEA